MEHKLLASPSPKHQAHSTSSSKRVAAFTLWCSFSASCSSTILCNRRVIRFCTVGLNDYCGSNVCTLYGTTSLFAVGDDVPKFRVARHNLFHGNSWSGCDLLGSRALVFRRTCSKSKLCRCVSHASFLSQCVVTSQLRDYITGLFANFVEFS